MGTEFGIKGILSFSHRLKGKKMGGEKTEHGRFVTLVLLGLSFMSKDKSSVRVALSLEHFEILQRSNRF